MLMAPRISCVEAWVTVQQCSEVGLGVMTDHEGSNLRNGLIYLFTQNFMGLGRSWRL